MKVKLGLISKLVIGIILGVLIGSFAPDWLARIVITASGLFSTFLKFIIPLMILAYVTKGISDLSQGAGKLLGITAGLSYVSTIVAGIGAFFVAITLFPKFMDASALEKIASASGISLSTYFSVPLSPVLDTMAAVALAFTFGLCLSSMRGRDIGTIIYDGVGEFSKMIDKILHVVIIPLLPLYICGTFIDMTKSGKTFVILGILWKVFLVVIILHLIYLIILFVVAGGIGKKNPFTLIKNQIAGYTTAIGTQSSAATIPVNLECAKKNGISEEIRNFTVPLCANIHMAGSMITITSCITAVCLMNSIPISIGVVIPFLATLGIAMVASPGAPGGAIMTALPFLYMIGLESPELQAIMVALYITQDSFGTACNVSGDNAIGVIVDTLYKKFIKK